MFTSSQRRKRGKWREGIWKETSAQEIPKKPKEWLSNYDKIKRGLTEQPGKQGKLFQKANFAKKRNFKPSSPETMDAGNNTQPKATQKAKKKVANKPAKKEEQEWFSNTTNPDIVIAREKTNFKAIFKESQDIRERTAVKMVLHEKIPSLKLEAGTILNGVPSFVGGRIHIKITSAQVGTGLIDLTQHGLLCLDDPSLLVGLCTMTT